MDATNVRNAPLHQPENLGCCQVRSPCAVTVLVLAIVLMIGSVVASGLLYQHVGNHAFAALAGVPIAIGMTVLVCRVKIQPLSTSGSSEASTNDKKLPTDFDNGKVSTDDEDVPWLDIADMISNEGRQEDITIGSQTNPCKSEEEIQRALQPYQNRKDIHTLIINCNGVKLKQVSEIVAISPVFLILVHGKLVRGELDRTLSNHYEWSFDPGIGQYGRSVPGIEGTDWSFDPTTGNYTIKATGNIVKTNDHISWREDQPRTTVKTAHSLEEALRRREDLNDKKHYVIVVLPPTS